MKRGAQVLLAVGQSLLLAGFLSSTVFAATVTTVPEQPRLPSAPLLITAYQRDATNELQFIQLYNDGKEPIALSDWIVTTEIATSANVLAGNEGYVLPGHHFVIDVGDAAGGNGKMLATLATTLTVRHLKQQFTDGAYVLKSVSTIWVRTEGTDGYSTAKDPFVAAVPDAERKIRLEDSVLYSAPKRASSIRIVEVYPKASDCAPDAPNKEFCHDYIKLFIPTGADVDSFRLRSSSSSDKSVMANTFTIIPANQYGFAYIALRDDGVNMELNDSGYVWIEDLLGGNISSVVSYSASTDQQGLSYALDESGNWQWTTDPRPYEANSIKPPVAATTVCPEGKYLNPDTNRCRTIAETLSVLAACEEGYERNPVTNRCRKIATATTGLVPCGEGQERNPATNRCRSIASAVAELMPCDEGYERNPATNRCRKVTVQTTATPTTQKLVDTAAATGWNAWTIALVAVGATGAIGYGVYEWRHELLGFGQKIAGRFGKK